jgi:hypothetical protein
MSWTNSDAIHRHACHALEDFERLAYARHVRHDRADDRELWHSLSHHLRHVVHRSSHEVADRRVRSKIVRRSHVASSHR